MSSSSTIPLLRTGRSIRKPTLFSSETASTFLQDFPPRRRDSIAILYSMQLKPNGLLFTHGTSLSYWNFKLVNCDRVLHGYGELEEKLVECGWGKEVS